MAWGVDCWLWDDSIDEENLEQFDYGTIPDEQFVMTTWHSDDTLEEAVRFAKIDAVRAFDDSVLSDLLVLDFSDRAREARIRQIFETAR